MIELFYERLASIKGKKKWRKFFKFLRKNFGENDPGKIDFDFESKPSRIEVVQKIINLKEYKSYLEIGTFNDELFSKIVCKKKIGVDPYSGGNIRMSSDSFFLQNKESFDCIFIDGLHHYNQVLKDIDNSLKILNSNGLILIHDCLPKTLDAQAVPRTDVEWNGDVWKVFVSKRVKNVLDTYTCYADHGIGVILKRQNRNLLNLQMNNFKKLRYNDFFINHKKYMNIVEFSDLIKFI